MDRKAEALRFTGIRFWLWVLRKKFWFVLVLVKD